MKDPVSRETLLQAMAPAIKRARTRLGLTQDSLAEHMALTTEFMGRIERGRALPSLETFVSLLDMLGVSADELLGTVHVAQQPPLDPLVDTRPDLAKLAMRIMDLERLGRAAVVAVLRAMEARAARDTD
jgi:transcriptional regulator with XRE-family HTH domain